MRSSRLRNQLELDSLLEELTALLPKPQLHAIYEEAVREPCSFLYVYLLNDRDKMFHLRVERRFEDTATNDGSALVDGNLEAAGQQHPVPK